MVSIQEINNPVEKFVAFIAEREAIRIRRFVIQKPWPWTNDTILQEYRFTNIHREDDAVSQHYQKIIRNRYVNDALVLPATVAYRWFNRPSTCNVLFMTNLDNLSPFEHYIQTGDLSHLTNALYNFPRPHVTGAFIITGKPGYNKTEGVLQYIHTWCQKPWKELYEVWKKYPPLLSEMYTQINSDGLGSFMRGQIIADLKYLPFMQFCPDWWTWATPGPGSMRGLNIVMDRPLMAPYKKGQWLSELQDLAMIVTPLLKEYRIDRLHNQDLQNCLCEYSKYTKVARGEGRPRQTFKNRAA